MRRDQTLRGRFNKVRSALKGVENVYTQHRPLLDELLHALYEQRLPLADYPYIGAYFIHSRLSFLNHMI